MTDDNDKPLVGKDLSKILLSGLGGAALAMLIGWMALSERVTRVEERSRSIQEQLADISRKLDTVLYRRGESYPQANGAPR